MKGQELFKYQLAKFFFNSIKPVSSLYYEDFYGMPYKDLYYLYKRNFDMKRIDRLNRYLLEGGNFNNIFWKENNLFDINEITNHYICHEMFWNAFLGYSKMFIQIPNIINEEFSESNGETISLSCSLLTSQMFAYDNFIFQLINNEENEGDREFRSAVFDYYRPYLFGYVVNVNKNDFERIKQFQKKIMEIGQEEEVYNEESAYIWLECAFSNDIEREIVRRDEQVIEVEGYIVQSASNIIKQKANIFIYNKKIRDVVNNAKEIKENYELPKNSCISDKNFIDKLENNMFSLSDIYVYKIGDGNCIYLENKAKNKGCFYDIGFNYRHKPGKIHKGDSFDYNLTINKIKQKDPSCIILSHWDMDHIAGSYAMSKDYLDKEWFAPDCYDACANAKRLAKYLHLKGKLSRIKRKKSGNGRIIGSFNLKDNVEYKFLAGEKASCDSSKANCEGIVIKYADKTTGTSVLMMGDVNYESYNKAVKSDKKEKEIKDLEMDYLIVPHHGSEHTNYKLLNKGRTNNYWGEEAIICCTGDVKSNRPNTEHEDELTKRFRVVGTTENYADPKNGYINIKL